MVSVSQLKMKNLINIDFHVIVAYGVSICTVSDNLIETVKYKSGVIYGHEDQ